MRAATHQYANPNSDVIAVVAISEPAFRKRSPCSATDLRSRLLARLATAPIVIGASLQRYVGVATTRRRGGRQRGGDAAAGVRGVDNRVDDAERDRPGQTALGPLVRVDQARVLHGVVSPTGARARSRRCNRLTAAALPITAMVASGHANTAVAPNAREFMAMYAPPNALRAPRVTRGTVALGERVQELGAPANDATPLLSTPGRYPGHVGENHQRYAERIAHTHEPGGLLGTERVETAALGEGVVRDHADGATGQSAEPDDHVRRPFRLEFTERAVFGAGRGSPGTTGRTS